MISLVLYGRNDSYGYNLHKRAALSLNCMAQVLTDPEDEILFVDYNTPDDFPTFPEAIYDTLTEHTKKILRIIRVRPDVHQKYFADKTRLIALEPISRNVAIRRSNPNNRWILSTNTDMIFVLQNGHESLSDAVRDLPDGIYCAPRVEIPETLWESLDRKDPSGTIEVTRKWGEDAHLNEIVHGAKTIRYDAPGDFQLMLRQDLFKIGAFHEEMLKGWHLDSNISKRLDMIYGEVSDAMPFVIGYHCDHTRQITPMHAAKSPSNSIKTYIDEVKIAEIPEQMSTWGLSGLSLEEVNLGSTLNPLYQSAIQALLPKPLEQPFLTHYTADFWGKQQSTAQHVLPFLLDLFANSPRSSKFAWIGEKDALFELFSSGLEIMGFEEALCTPDEGSEIESAIRECQALLFNFMPEDETGYGDKLLGKLQKAVFYERSAQYNGGVPTRFVGINAIHNRFESFFTDVIASAKTPFSSHIRHGFLFKELMEDKMRTATLDDMFVGDAAVVTQGAFFSQMGKKGCVCFGPNVIANFSKDLKIDFELKLDLKSILKIGMQLSRKFAVLEVVIDEIVVKKFNLNYRRDGIYVYSLKLRRQDMGKPIQARLMKARRVNLTIKNMRVQTL